MHYNVSEMYTDRTPQSKQQKSIIKLVNLCIFHWALHMPIIILKSKCNTATAIVNILLFLDGTADDLDLCPDLLDGEALFETLIKGMATLCL